MRHRGQGCGSACKKDPVSSMKLFTVQLGLSAAAWDVPPFRLNLPRHLWGYGTPQFSIPLSHGSKIHCSLGEMWWSNLRLAREVLKIDVRIPPFDPGPATGRQPQASEASGKTLAFAGPWRCGHARTAPLLSVTHMERPAELRHLWFKRSQHPRRRDAVHSKTCSRAKVGCGGEWLACLDGVTSSLGCSFDRRRCRS